MYTIDIAAEVAITSVQGAPLGPLLFCKSFIFTYVVPVEARETDRHTYRLMMTEVRTNVSSRKNTQTHYDDLDLSIFHQDLNPMIYTLSSKGPAFSELLPPKCPQPDRYTHGDNSATFDMR